MTQELTDRLRGKCTGLLDCCIDFFVGPWRESIRTDKLLWREHTRLLHGFGDHTGRRPFGYIPCPQCLSTRNFVRAHKCSTGCICGIYQRELATHVRSIDEHY